jgi:hypothetical protein
MGLFHKIVYEQGPYKEVYVYFRGVLIYKMWFVEGLKCASRVFHEGER